LGRAGGGGDTVFQGSFGATGITTLVVLKTMVLLELVK
jgi:hypothetical protein